MYPKLHLIYFVCLALAQTSMAQVQSLMKNPSIVWLAESYVDCQVSDAQRWQENPTLYVLADSSHQPHWQRSQLLKYQTELGQDHLMACLQHHLFDPLLEAYADVELRQRLSPAALEKSQKFGWYDKTRPIEESRRVFQRSLSNYFYGLRLHQVLFYDASKKRLGIQLLALGVVVRNPDKTAQDREELSVAYWLPIDAGWGLPSLNDGQLSYAESVELAILFPQLKTLKSDWAWEKVLEEQLKTQVQEAQRVKAVDELTHGSPLLSAKAIQAAFAESITDTLGMDGENTNSVLRPLAPQIKGIQLHYVFVWQAKTRRMAVYAHSYAWRRPIVDQQNNFLGIAILPYLFWK